jgi:hypothetical protein
LPANKTSTGLFGLAGRRSVRVRGLGDVAAGFVDGALVAGAGALTAVTVVASPGAPVALSPLADLEVRPRFSFVAAPPVAADLGRARDAPLV